MPIIRYLIWLGFLAVLSVQDYRTMRLKFHTLLAAAACGTVFWFVCRPFSGLQLAAGAGLGGGLALAAWLSHGKIGGGDAAAAAIGGIWLGFSVALTELFLASLIGAAAGAVQILRKKKTREDVIPFVPFLFLAQAALTACVIAGSRV